MDDNLLLEREHLAQADRHVAEAKNHIARQKARRYLAGPPYGFRRIAPLLDGPGPRCLHYLAKADDRVIVRNSASVKIKHEEPNGG
jgi:hypothetical protein